MSACGCSANQSRRQAIQASSAANAGAPTGTVRRLPPLPSTCCGRGCGTCVWEAYYNALDWWREDALDAVRAAHFGKDRAMAAR